MVGPPSYRKAITRSSIILFFIFLCVLPPVQGRNGGLVYQNRIGGREVDKVYDYVVTPDNGLLLVGSTTSFDVDDEEDDLDF